jgi:hypothetical protein
MKLIPSTKTLPSNQKLKNINIAFFSSSSSSRGNLNIYGSLYSVKEEEHKDNYEQLSKLNIKQLKNIESLITLGHKKIVHKDFTLTVVLV